MSPGANSIFLFEMERKFGELYILMTTMISFKLDGGERVAVDSNKVGLVSVWSQMLVDIS